MSEQHTQSTPERILEAALDVFAEHGYRGATTRTLAAAADVNIATLAYHFKGKEGLYQAAIDQIYERFAQVKPELDMPANASSAQRVEAAVRFAYRFARENMRSVRLLIRHFIEHGHLPDRVRRDWEPQLLLRAELAWALLGLPADPAWKVKILTMNHLIARFAITEPEDLERYLQDGEADRAHEVVEDHLVEVAQKMLGC